MHLLLFLIVSYSNIGHEQLCEDLLVGWVALCSCLIQFHHLAIWRKETTSSTPSSSSSSSMLTVAKFPAVHRHCLQCSGVSRLALDDTIN